MKGGTPLDTTGKAKRSYRVLTAVDRDEIMVLYRSHCSIREISRRLGRNVSVISREIKRNSTEDGVYQASWAQTRSDIRRKESRRRPRIPDESIRGYIREKLKLKWSPEQIAGRLRIDMPGKRVSHETIYLFIFKVEPQLKDYLLCGRKHRKHRSKRYQKRSLIPKRVGIEHRPPEVALRSEVGHWEGDTAVSRQSNASLMVLHERATGLTLLSKLPRCAPTEMKDAVVTRLGELPSGLVRSITFDNGQENRYHEEVTRSLGIPVYFCQPYHSWEKGSVENTVGLTRRIWPKKTDYALIQDEEIAKLERELNSRPRKRFGYRTPLEMLSAVASSP
jgi:IS30 family transposase